MQVISRSRSPFPRTFPVAFTECFCSRRRFNSHFHSMRIPSPVKAVRPRGCAGCSVCPLLGLGLAQGKRRRKRRKKGGGGKEKREEGEEGRSGRRLTILARRNTSTPPVLGKWRGTVGTFLVTISRHRAVPIPAPQAAAAVLGEPLCLLSPERGTTCSILQEHRCLNGLGIQGNIEGGALNTLPPLLGKFPERSHIEQEKKSLRAILSPEHSHHLPSPASSHRSGFPALLLARGFTWQPLGQ